jgi:hypothetical protein
MSPRHMFAVAALTAAAGLFPIAADAQVLKVVHNFSGAGDGEFPTAGLLEQGGTLYGTNSPTMAASFMELQPRAGLEAEPRFFSSIPSRVPKPSFAAFPS